MNTSNFRLLLSGLALGVLLALLIAPQTRWLVRLQILPPSAGQSNYERQKKQFVDAHITDYQVQLAGQTTSYETVKQVQYARSLIARFPESASLRANILRYALGNFHLYRPEDFLLQGIPVPDHLDDPKYPPPTPAEIAAFDADAAAGERLDPNNAYFPLLRMFGLFAAHRDTEALAALQRASQDTLWREYFEDEVEGHWRINDGIYGGREAIASMAIFASVLFPHYQHLREIARIVTYKAVLLEQAGHHEAGLALRRQMMHCGELMRGQSTTIIGSLVGIAISGVARSRPGGSAVVYSRPNESLEQAANRRLDNYCTYVMRIGHPEAAQEARDAAAATAQTRKVIGHIGQYTFGVSTSDLIRSVLALASGWLIFAAAVCLLALTLLATALSRLPSVRQQMPLPIPVSLGILGGLVLGIAVLANYMANTPGQFRFEAALITGAFFAAIGAFAAVPRFRRPVRLALLAALATLAAAAGAACLAAWQSQEAIGLANSMGGMLSLSGDEAASPHLSLTVQQVQGISLVLFSPVLLAVILSITARVRRVPVSVGLIGGFRRTGAVLVPLFVLLYGVLAVITVRQEARLNYGLERSLHGEGQYLAQLTGEKWPGR